MQQKHTTHSAATLDPLHLVVTLDNDDAPYLVIPDDLKAFTAPPLLDVLFSVSWRVRYQIVRSAMARIEVVGLS